MASRPYTSELWFSAACQALRHSAKTGVPAEPGSRHRNVSSISMRGIDRSSTGGASNSRRAGNDQILGIAEGNVEDISGRHCKIRSLALLNISERYFRFGVIALP